MTGWCRARLTFCGYEADSVYFALVGENFKGHAFWQGMTIDEDKKENVAHIMRRFDMCFEELDRKFRDFMAPESAGSFEDANECMVDANEEVFPVVVGTVRSMLKLKGVPYWVRPNPMQGEKHEESARSAAAGGGPGGRSSGGGEAFD